MSTGDQHHVSEALGAFALPSSNEKERKNCPLCLPLTDVAPGADEDAGSWQPVKAGEASGKSSSRGKSVIRHSLVAIATAE